MSETISNKDALVPTELERYVVFHSVPGGYWFKLRDEVGFTEVCEWAQKVICAYIEQHEANVTKELVSKGLELFHADSKIFVSVADQLFGAILIPSSSLQFITTDFQLKIVASNHVGHPNYKPMLILSLE